MSDLVGNPEEVFSRNAAHIIQRIMGILSQGILYSGTHPRLGLSPVTRKQALHLWEYVQLLCFRNIDSTIPLLVESEISNS